VPQEQGADGVYKSILAVSEGGPDAAMSFRLAAHIASMFAGVVDAVHFSESQPHDVDIAAQAMPFLKPLSDERLKQRAIESRRVFGEVLAALPGATFTGDQAMTREQLVNSGRYADLVIIGRPGSDEENVSPETVKAAIHESARPVMIAPPEPGSRPFDSVIIAWNGSMQAARAVDLAHPLLARARKVTVLVADAAPNAVGVPFLLRNFERHGIDASLDAREFGAVTARGRGRALLGYAKDKGADLVVMGAYGHGGLSNFLGLGGATAKVIAACPVPLLLAH
jgi:nucleotide-binding universal stress UspA family protein